MKFADAIIIGSGEHSASYDLLSEIPAGIQKPNFLSFQTVSMI
jgi:hypothetical protein